MKLRQGLSFQARSRLTRDANKIRLVGNIMVDALMSVLIDVSELTFGYGREVILKDVSLKVGAGEILIILGPNGSGKTTLLRVLAGVLKPSRGSVSMLGKGVDRADYLLDADVGIDDYTFSNLTFFEALYYHLVLRGVETSKARETANAYLKLFDVLRAGKTYLRRLSAGQRKLAMILPAVASHSKVLLLDEPFEQVDPTRKVKLAREIISLASSGSAVVLNTHEIEALELLNDASVGIMLDGRYFGTVKPAGLLLDSYLVRQRPTEGQVILEIDAEGGKAYITTGETKGARPLRRIEDLAQLYALSAR
jgi:ABC-type multidrug transport system ATPase subunit